MTHPTPPNKRRLWRLLIHVVAALALLVAFSPLLLGHTLLLPVVRAVLGPRTVADGAWLGWGGDLELEGVVVEPSEDGGEALSLHVDRLRFDADVRDWARGWSLGTPVPGQLELGPAHVQFDLTPPERPAASSREGGRAAAVAETVGLPEQLPMALQPAFQLDGIDLDVLHGVGEERLRVQWVGLALRGAASVERSLELHLLNEARGFASALRVDVLGPDGARSLAVLEDVHLSVLALDLVPPFDLRRVRCGLQIEASRGTLGGLAFKELSGDLELEGGRLDLRLAGRCGSGFARGRLVLDPALPEEALRVEVEAERLQARGAAGEVLATLFPPLHTDAPHPGLPRVGLRASSVWSTALGAQARQDLLGAIREAQLEVLLHTESGPWFDSTWLRRVLDAWNGVSPAPFTAEGVRQGWARLRIDRGGVETLEAALEGPQTRVSWRGRVGLDRAVELRVSLHDAHPGPTLRRALGVLEGRGGLQVGGTLARPQVEVPELRPEWAQREP